MKIKTRCELKRKTPRKVPSSAEPYSVEPIVRCADCRWFVPQFILDGIQIGGPDGGICESPGCVPELLKDINDIEELWVYKYSLGCVSGERRAESENKKAMP